MQNKNATAETDASLKNSALGTPHSTLPPSRARTGKIARLPAQIRETVNSMLHDGTPYGQIIARLAELGHPGFLDQNISRWRKGGYQDWLRDRRESHELEHHTKVLLDLAKDPASGINVADANQILMALRLQQALLAFDSRMASALASHDINAFFKLARATNSQMAERTRRQRVDLDRRKLQDALASEDDADTEILKIICDRLRESVASESIKAGSTSSNVSITPSNTCSHQC